MRFGSVDMFMEFGEWDFRMGRPVANESFLKALLTHGCYDTYEFFCPDMYHLERFSKRIKELIYDEQMLSRVKATLQIGLAESFRSSQYDVFHLGDFTHFMPYLIGIRNNYAKYPFPITGVTHSLDAVHMNLRYVELILAGLAPFDGIICTSRAARKKVNKGLTWMLEQLREKFGGGITAEPSVKIIPLGIDDALFEEYDKASARSYFNIPENMIVALSVGRLSLRHKADWSPTLELLARMCSSGSMEDFILLIAGGAEESDISLLESLIARLGLERRVILFPNFPSEAKSRLYHAADFYLSIVDNFQETFGLNIIEAMVSGLPVICSDFSGYRDLVTHGEDGFLLPTLWSRQLPEFLKENLGILDPSVVKLYSSQMVAIDLVTLQEALTTLYNEENLRTSMGFAAKKKSHRYRWKKVIRSYESFWEDLSKEAKKANPTIFQTSTNVLEGDPAKTFSHYPSRVINDNDFVTVTDVGHSVIDKGESFIKYDDVGVCLFSDLEGFILQTLIEGGQSVYTIKEEAAKQLEATGGQTEFHLLWLLKHGALVLGNI